MTKLEDPLPIPCGRRVKGEVTVPPSKSVSHRVVNLALLSGNKAIVEHLLVSEDLDLFLEALDSCGVVVRRRPGRVELEPRSAEVSGEHRERTLYCGNAGTMFRFLTATLTAIPGRFKLDGSARLRERPIAPLVEALQRLGAGLRYAERPGFAPLEIEGSSLEGGTVELDASDSSQYVSAILMAALRAREPTTLVVRSLSSSPYVAITQQLIEQLAPGSVKEENGVFRIEPCEFSLPDGYRVEGDYSAAAYPAAAAALTAGRVTLRGLRRDSLQGDRQFMGCLEQLGATVTWQGDDRLSVCGGELEALGEVDFGDMPDQVPTLAAVAAFCRGTTRIRGVGHLRHKESDRLQAMSKELSRLGFEVDELEDGLELRGSNGFGMPATEVTVCDTYNDHRIAMSLALVGLRRGGVAVRDPMTVGKSYPDFWRHLFRLLE